MTTQILEVPAPTVCPEPSTQANLPAWRFAKEITARVQGLLPVMQPVCFSWLTAQSSGALETCTQEEIFLWLNDLHPGHAESEYRLILMEISWLETLTEDFISFLNKEPR